MTPRRRHVGVAEHAGNLLYPRLTLHNFHITRRNATLLSLCNHKMLVGVHNHSRIDPNEFATTKNFTDAMAASPFIATNLDIGHFTAANEDAVAFLKQHHARIVTLHIKDRKRNEGATVPFGEGDAPIGKVLGLLQQNGWPIPANIEYEYKGADSVDEVGKCLAYCRKALSL